MIRSYNRKSQTDSVLLFFSSVIFVCAFLVITYVIYTPRWETNDDVAMSMVAHGYGLSEHPSPNIIFSNVLWGYLVKNIPSIHGVLGYSVATIASIFLAGTGILYFLRKIELEPSIAAAIVVLILLRPLVFPQFTLNSGLLAIASVLALIQYARDKETSSLLMSIVFSLLAFLIRSEEFIIILISALPFINLKKLISDAKFRNFATATILLIFSLVIIDWLAYRGADWAHFHELNKARAAYTDFGISEQLKNHPEIMSRYGYTSNDLDLIRNYFFSDSLIANPDILNAMSKDLGALPFIKANFPLALISVKSLFSFNIWPITAMAFILFSLRPGFKAASAFIFVFLFAFLLGLIGRGGLERVLYPLAAMLSVLMAAQLAHCQPNAGSTKLFGINRTLFYAFLIFLLITINLLKLNKQSVTTNQEIITLQNEARNFPPDLIFVWGGGVHIESIFPLLANDASLRKMKLYGLGVFTYAPFSRSYTEETEGKGFVQRIRSPDGILMVASKENIRYLSIWCNERYNGFLKDKIIFHGPETDVDRIECTTP